MKTNSELLPFGPDYSHNVDHISSAAVDGGRGLFLDCYLSYNFLDPIDQHKLSDS